MCFSSQDEVDEDGSKAKDDDGAESVYGGLEAAHCLSCRPHYPHALHQEQIDQCLSNMSQYVSQYMSVAFRIGPSNADLTLLNA